MKVAIIGAGGHSRTIINLLELSNIDIEGVYDDNFNLNEVEYIDQIRLKGKLSDIPENCKIVIGKGEPNEIQTLKKEFQHQLLIENIIHPTAVIDSKNLGKSNQICALTYIAKTANIGDCNLIYSNSSIEHEVIIGNNNVLTVNVTICGRVKIGNNCFLGASSTILPSVSIHDNVIIGAGSVVTKDISEPGTYVGIPAKKIK